MFVWAVKRATEVAVSTSTRTAETNKHDRVRLMHLFVCLSAQPDWSAAPLTRLQLDTRSQSVNTASDPFQRLADKFNNYEDYVFQNLTVEYTNGIMVSPYRARPMMTSLADNCWDLNPTVTDPMRPERNGEWVKKTWLDMRGSISKIRSNYMRSGNQDAENRYDEWQKFSKTAYGDTYTYAMVVIPLGMLDQLGKELPSEIGRDSGDAAAPSTTRSYSNTVGARNRKRQRMRRKLLISGKLDYLDEKPTNDEEDNIESLPRVLSEGLENDKKHKALEFLAVHGNEDDKKLVLEQMRMLAGLFGGPKVTPKPKMVVTKRKVVESEDDLDDVQSFCNDKTYDAAYDSDSTVHVESDQVLVEVKGFKCKECQGMILFSSSQQFDTQRTNHMCKVCDKALHDYCGLDDGNCEMNRLCKGECAKEWKRRNPSYVPLIMLD